MGPADPEAYEDRRQSAPSLEGAGTYVGNATGVQTFRQKENQCRTQ